MNSLRVSKLLAAVALIMIPLSGFAVEETEIYLVRDATIYREPGRLDPNHKEFVWFASKDQPGGNVVPSKQVIAATEEVADEFDRLIQRFPIYGTPPQNVLGGMFTKGGTLRYPILKCVVKSRNSNYRGDWGSNWNAQFLQIFSIRQCEQVRAQ